MFKSINGGQFPQRATKYSAGFDVFANEDVVIGAGKTKLIGLGIAIDDEFFTKRHEKASSHFYEWAKDRTKTDKEAIRMAKENGDTNIDSFKSQYYFALHIRSSLRAKGLTSLGPGVIDIDYRDEIKMVIHNSVRVFKTQSREECFDASNGFKIKKGDKIGQLILCRHEGYLLPSEYTKSEERIGAFGSTDA